MTTHQPPFAAKGLNVHTCECGSTCWAFPFNDQQTAWDAYQRSPIRQIIDEKGIAPPQSRTSLHVIIADARDGDLLRQRRWRVLPSKPWMPHKVELRGGTGRGLALHTHVMDGAKPLLVINGYGCDVRRANLKLMTWDEVKAAARARKSSRRKNVR